MRQGGNIYQLFRPAVNASAFAFTMRKKVLDRSPSLHALPEEEFFRMLLGVVPAETADYLRRVTTRMPNYASMF